MNNLGSILTCCRTQSENKTILAVFVTLLIFLIVLI